MGDNRTDRTEPSGYEMAELPKEARDELEESFALLLMIIWASDFNASNIREVMREQGIDHRVDEILRRSVEKFDQEVGTVKFIGLQTSDLVSMRETYLNDLSVRLLERQQRHSEQVRLDEREAARFGQPPPERPGYTESDAKGEARTSVTDLQANTEFAAAEKYKVNAGVVLHPFWFTEPGACPICEPLHGQGKETWENVYPKGPPGHPNCRCHLEWLVVSMPEPRQQVAA